MKMQTNRAKIEAAKPDLTPMLDVVFILLIFFVVTASFLSETAIALASTEANEETVVPLESESVLITIDADNRVRFNAQQRPVIESQILANIARYKAENSGIGIVISADDLSAVSTLVRVMDAARQAGVINISILESSI